MNSFIAPTAVVHPGVELGDNCVVEDFCVIGCPPRGRGPGELATRIGSNAVIRSFSVIYAGNTIGDDFQCGNKANIREENRIGNRVSIGTLSVVEHHVVLEDGVRIHTQAFVPEYSTLKRGCWIGPHAVLTNAKFPNRPDTKDNLQGPVIGANAVLGANCTVLPGVQIGENALVGAGSVVTKNVAPGAVVKGNPAA
jgi:acetyltransferase-like isoleucine patch superfamily enzyme